MSDNVEHPSHYNTGDVETIDAIKSALGDGFLDYCRGNVIKYVWRCRHKGNTLEDLRKAAKYLEWAIEEAESEKPSEPKPLAIPDGWRELEPKETPLSSDMHEHEGMWVKRFDDANCEYEWYDVRHIRKIETASSSEVPSSSIPDPGPGYRLLSKDPPEPVIEGDEFCSPGSGEWLQSKNWRAGVVQCSSYYRRKIEPTETSDASIPDPGPGYRLLSKDPPERVVNGVQFWDASTKQWHDCKSVEGHEPQVTGYYYRRKIETENPSEIPNSSLPDPGPGYRLLSKDPPERVVEGDEYLAFDGEWSESENWRAGVVQCSSYYRRKIEPTETSDASIPDPGPGYRLLSKDPPERVVKGDEYLAFDGEWSESENWRHGSSPQAERYYYRRKIEPTEWIPKVGDRVRVARGFMNPIGEVGIVKDFCPVVNGNFSILAHEGRCTLGWFKKDDVELIEAAP